MTDTATKPALPIHYCKVHVGFVFLDTDICRSLQHLPWHLELPAALRRKRYGLDVLLGLLQEDESLQHKCTPYMMLNGTTGFKVRLAKVVLHPELIPLLNQYTLRANPRKEILFHDIRSRLMKVGRIVHLDGNRLNCQATNLRELSYEPLEEQSGLFHED